jgi:hypothetical protein
VKAAVLILAILLVLAHPAAAAAVVAIELGVCAVLGWYIWRAFRRSPTWRPA